MHSEEKKWQHHELNCSPYVGCNGGGGVEIHMEGRMVDVVKHHSPLTQFHLELAFSMALWCQSVKNK